MKYVTIKTEQQSVCPACGSAKRDGYHNTRKIDCGAMVIVRRRTRCRSCDTLRLEMVLEIAEDKVQNAECQNAQLELF